MNERLSLTRRRFLSCSLTAVTAVLVGACSKKTEPTATVAEPTTAAAEPTAAAKPIAAAAEPTAETAEPAAGSAPSLYQEAPEWVELVKQGELPPIEERLPKEPCVAPRTGKYGGTMHLAMVTDELQPTGLWAYGMMLGKPLRLSEDQQSYVPNLFKDVVMSDDKKSFTCYMREGVRWSDGEPYTADDWVFWREDILGWPDLVTAEPTFFAGGKLLELTKIDDYSFRIDFAEPYPAFHWMHFVHTFGFWDFQAPPSHFLKPYHIKYNEKAEEEAKAEGYNTWQERFNTVGYSRNSAEVPTLRTHIPDEVGPDRVTFKRNPYYWMVDEDGKQLPYIDKIVLQRVADRAVRQTKILAGELDADLGAVQFGDYQTFKDGEEKGGYIVKIWPGNDQSIAIFCFNQNYPDEVWRSVFQDARFRRAMSVAIDRDEINEVVYQGMARPGAFTAHHTSRAYKEEYGQAWAQYDPDLANQLLDEMGLQWNDQHTIRLLPDGREMKINFLMWKEHEGQGGRELVYEYWRNIGVDVTYKFAERALIQEKTLANEQMMSTWTGDETHDLLLCRRAKFFVPGVGGGENSLAPLWGKYHHTQGKEGEPPNEEFAQLYEWLEEYLRTDSLEALDKILKSQAENVWHIGTVGDIPSPKIFSKGLRNVPEVCWDGWDTNNGHYAYPECWYFDDEEA